MRKILILALAFSGLNVFAQKDKDEDIVYYEDSYVKNSRFIIGAYGNPTYTDRRLINNEVPQGGGLDLADEEATGSFNFNYGAQLFYRIGSSFQVGSGFGYETASYSVEDAEFYLDESNLVDTTLRQTVDATTDISMMVVPIMINFNTRISETFGLEVIPTVKLTFIDDYQTEFTTQSGDTFTRDFTDLVRELNYQVGIDLGGTYYFTDKLGLFVHFNARYMINNMLERDDFPRETIYSFGSNLGLKYSL